MPNTILLLLILLDIYVCSSVAKVVSESPAVAPTSSHESQPRLPRKLGKDLAAPGQSPSGEKKAEEINSGGHKMSNEEANEAEGHESVLKRHHHGVDKSVAGGGVILGGLATTFLVAVFCYIRATTRRHKAESESDS